MSKGFLADMFSSDSSKPLPAAAAPLNQEIDVQYQPSKGTFFRTREYPEKDAQGQITGRIWLEAGYDAETAAWVLWQKASRQTEDMANGEKISLISSNALFEKTTFKNAFDQMMTFETSQKALGVAPMDTRTPARMGSDYYKQFAWQEGLMMSHSGRLYPYNEEQINAANHFDEQDIADAKAFLARLKTEQFVPVPIVLPAVDWEKAYLRDQKRIDQRLNALYFRFNNDRDNYALATQIIEQEAPGVLYKHLSNGFKPQIFQNDPARHFALAKAAIDRDSVEIINLLADAGMGFYVRQNGQTPLNYAIAQKRYSHMHVMLSRDDGTIANYNDENGNAPIVQAMVSQDNQAFKMLYLEGLDYQHADANGWFLIHHAFANNFMRGIYAWQDENLPIDQPVKGTNYTALSIARQKNNQPLIEYALKNGANAAAPAMPAAGTAPKLQQEKPVEFSLALLNSGATNDEIAAAAKAHVAAGGIFDQVDSKGASLFEICWKNRKPRLELDRRNLIPVFGALGADPSSLLSNGSTELVRAASGMTLDIDYLKAIAPFVKNVNQADSAGNNILHALQLNANDQVGHSRNVETLFRLFPALDMNLQNKDGYSNLGLAIRLNRAQTLKVLQSQPAPDLAQTTRNGWSLLDIAFTAACGREKVAGAARAASIPVTSDTTRNIVIDMIGAATPARRDSLSATFNRTRPDGKTLLEAASAENMSADMIVRLKACCLSPQS